MRTSAGQTSLKTGTGQQEHKSQQFNRLNAPIHALLALDAGRMGSWSLDVESGEVIGDRLVARLLGLGYEIQPWTIDDFFTSVHPDDRAAVHDAVDKAFSGETPYYDAIFRTTRKDADGSDMWLGARAQVTERAEDGRPLRVVGVNWDATAQKTQEKKLAMLAAEMDHRIKNAFAVILALVKIGDKVSPDKESFATTLRAQVEAMATAHALSARMARATNDADSELSILEILETSLAPWLDHHIDGPKRVMIACEPDALIPPRKVSPLAMALYEFSTSATKHGALAGAEGRVDIIVKRLSENKVELVWDETDNDETVLRPEADDFSEVLLQHCAQTLGGDMVQSQTNTGIRKVLTFDLSA